MDRDESSTFGSAGGSVFSGGWADDWDDDRGHGNGDGGGAFAAPDAGPSAGEGDGDGETWGSGWADNWDDGAATAWHDGANAPGGAGGDSWADWGDWGDAGETPPPRERTTPPAAVTASSLSAGEVLWAEVSEDAIRLGCGQVVHAPGGLPDRVRGWRPVRVTDPESLSVEVLGLGPARSRANAERR